MTVALLHNTGIQKVGSWTKQMH